MQPVDVYNKLGTVVPHIAGLYRAAIQAKLEALGVEPQTPQYYTLAVAQDFAPEPISAAKFIARNPYGNPATVEERLQTVAAKGWLVADGSGGYTLTDSGRAVVAGVHDVMVAHLSSVEPIPQTELQRIKALLGAVVKTAVNAAKPAEKMHLLYNRNSDVGDAGPLLLNILQYVADLGAFRDDAHLAAWRPQGVTGHAWEALTLIWRDEAHTAAELAEKLGPRQYDADVYAAALDELAAKGWITQVDGAYQITDAGKALRQEVEDLTDRYFYAPWAALSASELAELGALLDKLGPALEKINAARAEAQPQT